MSVGKLNRYGLPLSNVVNTGIATNNITPGRTIEKITLRMGGVAFTKAMVNGIKIKANGKPVLDCTGPQLDLINAYRGVAQAATFLDVNFADMSMWDDFDRQVGSFDTSVGILNITSEVSIVGANAPTLLPILTESATQREASGATAGFSGLISKYLSYPWNIANGGRLPVTVPFGPQNGAIIKRLHVFHTGNMTGATVKQDGLVIHESVKVENEYQQTQNRRTPQANVYTIDFVLDGKVSKALNTRDAKSLEWLFDFSAADNGTVIVEYLDPLGNL